MSPTAAASAYGSVSLRMRFQDASSNAGSSGAVPRIRATVATTSTAPITTLAQKNASRPASRSTRAMNRPDSVVERITPSSEIQPIRSWTSSGTV